MIKMSATSWSLRRVGLPALGVLSLHAGLIWILTSNPEALRPELVVPVSLLSQPADGSDAPAPAATKAAPRPNISEDPSGSDARPK